MGNRGQGMDGSLFWAWSSYVFVCGVAFGAWAWGWHLVGTLRRRNAELLAQLEETRNDLAAARRVR